MAYCTKSNGGTAAGFLLRVREFFGRRWTLNSLKEPRNGRCGKFRSKQRRELDPQACAKSKQRSACAGWKKWPEVWGPRCVCNNASYGEGTSIWVLRVDQIFGSRSQGRKKEKKKKEKKGMLFDFPWKKQGVVYSASDVVRNARSSVKPPLWSPR